MAEPEYSRDFLLTALFTGMRRGELTKLRWENVDLNSKVLHLPTTKNGDPLHLPLSSFLADLLGERWARNNSHLGSFRGRARAAIWLKPRSSCCVYRLGLVSASPYTTCGAPSSPSRKALTCPTTRSSAC